MDRYSMYNGYWGQDYKNKYNNLCRVYEIISKCVKMQYICYK